MAPIHPGAVSYRGAEGLRSLTPSDSTSSRTIRLLCLIAEPVWPTRRRRVACSTPGSDPSFILRPVFGEIYTAVSGLSGQASISSGAHGEPSVRRPHTVKRVNRYTHVRESTGFTQTSRQGTICVARTHQLLRASPRARPHRTIIPAPRDLARPARRRAAIRLGMWMDWNDPHELRRPARIDWQKDPSQQVTTTSADGTEVSDTARCCGPVGDARVGRQLFSPSPTRTTS